MYTRQLYSSVYLSACVIVCILIMKNVSRITPTYTMFTCSGRISMHEPNLQNVPRTFVIPSAYLSPESKTDNSCDVLEFNCRNIFRARPGHVLISADYCQLEMRILTHYCEDIVLTNIMKSNVDVFKSIAAIWGSVSEEDVSILIFLRSTYPL